MAKPTLLTVDDDPNVLKAIERDLRSRYGDKYRVLRALTIDTRGRPGASLRLRRHWAEIGAKRLVAPGPRDLFAYNVFSVSRADFERIRELEQQYFRHARAIIAGSSPSQVSGLLIAQLFEWDGTAPVPERSTSSASASASSTSRGVSAVIAPGPG